MKKMKNKILLLGIFVCATFLILPSIILTAEEEVDYASLGRDEYIKILDSLPDYLEGSLLDGNTRVIVTETGEIPYFIDINSYDVVLSMKEKTQIMNNKREEFITKNGIDPIPPYPIPDSVSEVEEYQEASDMDDLYGAKGYGGAQEQEEGWALEQVTPGDGPHQIDGQMFLAVFIPTDTAHRPYDVNVLKAKCAVGWSRFQQFDINTDWFEVWGCWDASDVGIDAEQQIDDFYDDYIALGLDLVYPDCVVNMGLVKQSNHNGIAYRNDFYCLVAEDCVGGFEHDKTDAKAENR